MPPNRSSGLSARTTNLVGGVVGGTLALLGVLLGLFFVSRRRRKVAAARDNPRLQAPRQMLDTDDFDLAEPPGPTPYAYGVVGARTNPNASGSIFHEDLPGTTAHHSHTNSHSVVGENDPLLTRHMRGSYPDAESITTASPRDSTHFRTSSTTGLLYDPADPFGDGRSDVGSSSRAHPMALAKAREAQPRVSDPHVYPPSSYHGRPNPEAYPMHPVGSNVLVHQDAGRVGAPNIGETPPSYASAGRPNRSPNIVLCTPTPAAVKPEGEELPDKVHNQLLTVQTHTGISNMGHALHILRAIEKEYGSIESFLFPRHKEPGSGDYLPNFFFKFRDVQSMYKLSKPYTHLDIPAFLPQLEPNHSIELKDIHALLSPATFPSPEGNSLLLTMIARNHPDDPVKARFAIRIEVSDKQDYPQQRLSPQAYAGQKNERIQDALATWKPAAYLACSPVAETVQPRVRPWSPSTKRSGLSAGNATPPTEETPDVQGLAPSTPRPESEPIDSPPLRMRPRAGWRQVIDDPPPAAHDVTSAESADPEPATVLPTDSPAPSTQHPNSKRERILEQTRRAAAAEAKLIADQKAAAEAAATAAAKQARETETQALQNTPLSIWSRFLGR
ncbi:hypothetical protein FRC10_006539 [Ceratobasidium sp. 414]|nr:hypothetical protein FRC10_006539 [Ceratobasidium sp. 414]